MARYNTIMRQIERAWDPNYTPARGVLCFESDTGRAKEGDGFTPWARLSYISTVEIADMDSIAFFGNVSFQHETNAAGEISLGDEGTRTRIVAAGTANRTLTLPNASGTVALLPDAGGTLGLASVVSDFTTAGAHGYTVPANAAMLLIRCWGGGGGGSSGSTGPWSSVNGGCGGAGGGYSDIWLTAAEAGSSLDIVVGAGGAGGAAISSSDTPGADGTDGEESTVQSGGVMRIRAPGGGKGSSIGGVQSTLCKNHAGYYVLGEGAWFGGGRGSTAAGEAGYNSAYTGGNGGAGGGMAATSFSVAGGAGGAGHVFSLGSITATDPFTLGQGNGTGRSTALGGDGGEGGASAPDAASNGVAGHAGYGFASGGGGGGSAVNTNTSGAGGNGKPGRVVIVTFF